MSLLKVTDLRVSYGGIEALRGISFDVEQGQIVTLIGANGAGKSTTLRAIAGLVKPAGGSIVFEGRDITTMDPQKVVASGIAMVPEGRRVFDNLTVHENLRIGAYLRKDETSIREDIDRVYELFPRLRERPAARRHALRRRTADARRRARHDDPPEAADDGRTVARPRAADRQGHIRHHPPPERFRITILLIEQNANAALRCANVGYVLETGNITMSGTAVSCSATSASATPTSARAEAAPAAGQARVAAAGAPREEEERGSAADASLSAKPARHAPACVAEARRLRCRDFLSCAAASACAPAHWARAFLCGRNDRRSRREWAME